MARRNVKRILGAAYALLALMVTVSLQASPPEIASAQGAGLSLEEPAAENGRPIGVEYKRPKKRPLGFPYQRPAG